MKCDLTICILNRQFECILDEPPSINDLGMCDGCMLVSFDDSIIEAAKEKQLEDFLRSTGQM